MALQTDQIALANVVAGAKPIDPMIEGGNRSFVGYVDASDGSRHRAFIKDLGRKQLCNELFASALGRALGLPMPRPFLALVDPEDMDEEFYLEHAPTLGHSAYRLVFASEDADCPSLSQLYIGDDVDVIIEKLREFPEFWHSLSFDEWVANIDRHPGNYLLSSARGVLLIDHDQCLTGPFWTLPALDPASHQRNRMIEEHLAGKLTDADVDRVVDSSKALSAEASAMSLDSVVVASLLKRAELGIVLPEELDAIYAFVCARAGLVLRCVSEKVGRRILV